MSWDDKNTKELFDRLERFESLMNKVLLTLASLSLNQPVAISAPKKFGRPKGSKNKRKRKEMSHE